MQKIKAFLSLSPSRKVLFLQALFLLPACQCCVKILRLKYLITLFRLQPYPVGMIPIGKNPDYIHSVKWSIEKAQSLPLFPRPRCLAEALTARLLLKKKNQMSVLSIGAALQNESMAAHAWLQCGEIIVTGQHHYAKYQTVISYI